MGLRQQGLQAAHAAFCKLCMLQAACSSGSSSKASCFPRCDGRPSYREPQAAAGRSLTHCCCLGFCSNMPASMFLP